MLWITLLCALNEPSLASDWYLKVWLSCSPITWMYKSSVNQIESALGREIPNRHVSELLTDEESLVKMTTLYCSNIFTSSLAFCNLYINKYNYWNVWLWATCCANEVYIYFVYVPQLRFQCIQMLFNLKHGMLSWGQFNTWFIV